MNTAQPITRKGQNFINSSQKPMAYKSMNLDKRPGYMPFRAITTIPSQLIKPSMSPGYTFLIKPVLENAYLLLPAVFGTGIAYLISLKSESTLEVCPDYPKPLEQGTCQGYLNEQYADGVAKLIVLTYVFGSISGIVLFIYRNVMGSSLKHPLIVLLPIGIELV